MVVGDVLWLIPGRVAGRPGPTYVPWFPAHLKAAGFDAVLNLSEHAPSERELAAAGLAVVWIPHHEAGKRQRGRRADSRGARVTAPNGRRPARRTHEPGGGGPSAVTPKCT